MTEQKATLWRPHVDLPLADGVARVKQLTFLHAMDFLKRLSGTAGKLSEARKLVTRPFDEAQGRPGGIVIDQAALVGIVQESEDLVMYLLKHATDMDDQRISALSATEGLAVIEAALRVNLSEDLIARGKSLGVVVGALIPRPNGATRTATTPSRGS